MARPADYYQPVTGRYWPSAGRWLAMAAAGFPDDLQVRGQQFRSMGLSNIAAGVEVTTEQRDRGVATVDRTEGSLADRLAAVADDLPCDGTTAATVVERYAGGGSVGAAARAGGIAPMTAAKTLHLLGESVSPVGPMGRDIVADYLAGDLPRTEARQLARVSETEFSLAVYVATHDPLPDGRAAVEDALAVDTDADPLAETMSDTVDLL